METRINNSQHDFIQTLRPDGKKGIRMSKHIYEQIVRIIIKEIRTSNEVTLTEILDIVKDQMPDHPNLEFIALQVKLDLEGKGFVKNKRSHFNPQRKHICMTRQGRRSFSTVDLKDVKDQQKDG